MEVIFSPDFRQNLYYTYIKFASSVYLTDEEGYKNNIIDNREMGVLLGRLSKRLANDISAFADKKEKERTQLAPKPSKLHKYAKELLKDFLDVGRVVIIAGGVTATTYFVNEFAGLGKDADNNKIEKKAHQSRKSDNDKTFDKWAKMVERNREFRS